MQDATAEFATAINKGEVVWHGPTVLVDWLEDGAQQATAGVQPGHVVDRFDDRDSSSTWTRPDRSPTTYVHVTGVNGDYTIVQGSYGRHGHTAGSTRNSFIQTGSSNMYGRLRFKFSSTPTGTGEVTVALVLRGDGTGVNHYEARAEFDLADSTIDIKLIERDASTSTAIETTNDFKTFVAGHTYVLVGQFNDEAELSLSRMKFYDEDVETEPVEWDLEHDVTPVAYGAYGGMRTVTPGTQTNSSPWYVHALDLRLIDSSIDDFSALAGQITIEQNLDDGLPSEVSSVADQGSVTANVKVLDGVRGLTAQQFLSVYNQRSPLYGLERDVAPVTIDHGVVTANGPEQLRLFTGKMVDLPVGTDGLGALVAMSETRLKLSKLIIPPPFNFAGDLSANWAVSLAAYLCGVYAAPNPPDGCITYAPLHGSLQLFRTYQFPDLALYGGVFSAAHASHMLDAGDGTYTSTLFEIDAEGLTPPYIHGPYVAAPDLQFTNEKAIGIYYNPMGSDFAPDGSDQVLSQAGPRGRFEWCVRGDAFDSVGPSGANLAPATFILGYLSQSNATAAKVHCGINMSRQLRIDISDGTASITLNAAAAFDLPTDGQWYKYGVAWDFVSETVYYYRRDPDGTEHESSSTNASLDVTRLPAVDDDFGVVQPFATVITLHSSQTFSRWFHSFLPCAELYLTAGTTANPNNAPWIWEDAYGFEPSAVFGLSSNRLRAIAEPVEREAWEYISAFAQAEMAAMRIDEYDRLMWLPTEYWAREAQQTAGDALDTLTNVGSLTPQIDPSRTRNAVRVAYGETRIDRLHQPLFSSRDVVAIAPGTQTLVIVLDELATYVDTSGATLPTQVQITAGVSNFVSSANWRTFFTFNSNTSGTGTVYSNGGSPDPTNDLVYAQVDDVFAASAVSVTIYNRTGITIYTANNNVEVPTISIGGLALRRNDASVLVTRDTSIARRGYRGLTVDTEMVQSADSAGRLASRVLNEVAEPTVILENVKLFGDPRRQPGDMVTFADSRDTAVSGNWRLTRVLHNINGADYTQDARLKPALEVFVWGQSRWGQAIWAREGL